MYILFFAFVLLVDHHFLAIAVLAFLAVYVWRKNSAGRAFRKGVRVGLHHAEAVRFFEEESLSLHLTPIFPFDEKDRVEDVEKAWDLAHSEGAELEGRIYSAENSERLRKLKQIFSL